MPTADAIVIGAGVVGASTAWALAGSGLSVRVVDRAAGPGLGSTSASSALVRFNYSTWAGVALSWEAKHAWEDWAGHLGGADPTGMARFRRTGIVFLDAPTIPLETTLPLFDRAGIPYERWTPDQLAARIPGLDPGVHFPPKPVDSEEFFADPTGRLGGLFTPDGGYVDDPQLAAANLAHAARSRGATFHFRRRVTAIERTGRTWTVATAEGDTLEAPVVVNAAGPWSGAVNRLCGADADFTVHTRPLRQEVHHVPGGPVTEDGPPLPLGDLDLGIYLRPDRGGLLVGGTEPECDPLHWLDDPDDADPRPTRAAYDAQLTRAARRFPDLPVPNRPRGIVGVYDVTQDWTPVYDRTALPGFYVAIGTSGNQFKNAPVVGPLMATLVDAVEGGRDHDADPVRFHCPRTGHDVDLGTFSRLRPLHASSGTVIG